MSFYNEEVDVVKNNQNKDLNGKKLTKLDSITINRNPSLDNELAKKKYDGDSFGESDVLRFNQTLEKYIKISFGNDIKNLTKFDKIQLTDTAMIKAPNNGSYLLRNWVIKCNDKNGNVKISNIIKSTKTISPTGEIGATSSPTIADSFMYIETSSNKNGDNVFCSFQRTDIIQNSNKTFYQNRSSAGGTKSMGRFRNQLLLDVNTCSTRYTIHKNDRYSDTMTY